MARYRATRTSASPIACVSGSVLSGGSGCPPRRSNMGDFFVSGDDDVGVGDSAFPDSTGEPASVFCVQRAQSTRMNVRSCENETELDNRGPCVGSRQDGSALLRLEGCELCLSCLSHLRVIVHTCEEWIAGGEARRSTACRTRFRFFLQ